MAVTAQRAVSAESAFCDLHGESLDIIYCVAQVCPEATGRACQRDPEQEVLNNDSMSGVQLLPPCLPCIVVFAAIACSG
jgi:hypothetical protein